MLEEHPRLWPGLTTVVTDTVGRTVIHYAAGRGTREAASLFGPDGVVAHWTSLLDEPTEVTRDLEQEHERVVTLRGGHAGYPVTVLFTVVGGD
ncbi:hypothetical protein [Nocardiopsis sp. MG754419]|uniref:hypothetical protein n=1 Tax=Nocardiopsis sp. MG754419 TaxID=2259865 RepID=UPI001BA8A6CD|nr:hypothetical protein [Nocardiopsis sp. MG754419]MBR8743755.1 hypothetical protein [Nocardiopsis sp. MG754419]